jgi:thiamine-phosphate pyrophosphorylase
VTDALRILDANLNRAREALRVMEDTARFVLQNPDLALDLKHARHQVRAVAESAGLDNLLLLAWRDTPGDVGTALATDSESDRPSIRGVAAAAGKRAGEALRVVEELLKIRDADLNSRAAPIAKALRYRVYELEKRLTLALGSGRGCAWRLCVLISESLCPNGDWERVARAALHGGAECLQLREKTLPARELLPHARTLQRLCAAEGAACVINDRPDIAVLAGAHAVHVGQEDLPVSAVRRLAGHGGLAVGVSTSSLPQARQAASDGADYCGVGPMFPTTTKHKPDIAGPAYLREYLADPQTARVPHLAIGGITPDNIDRLVACGCKGVAVSSAVCSAPDPERACRYLLESLDAPTRLGAASGNAG